MSAALTLALILGLPLAAVVWLVAWGEISERRKAKATAEFVRRYRGNRT